VGCGPAKGDEGLPDPFGHMSMPGFVSGVGKCAAFAQGAISLVIGVVMGLAGVHASENDERASVGLAVGACIAGVHAGGVTSPLGWVTGPNDASTSVAQSNMVWAVGGVVGSSPLSCEVSASRITNTVRKFTIASRIPSGNGPDQVSFHSNSIRRSLASHCATVLSDAGELAQVGKALGVAAIGFAMTGVCVAMPQCSQIFFVAFRQMSSMVVRGLMTK
jgi:hypothetical protein